MSRTEENQFVPFLCLSVCVAPGDQQVAAVSLDCINYKEAVSPDIFKVQHKDTLGRFNQEQMGVTSSTRLLRHDPNTSCHLGVALWHLRPGPVSPRKSLAPFSRFHLRRSI